MKFTSVHSAKDSLRDTLSRCRQKTLEIATQLDDETYFRQSHPAFSPVGWHLGHIAFIEAFWILERFAGLPTPVNANYQQLFAADGLPKDQRQHLPSLPVILDFLATTRSQVLNYLDIADWDKQERFWHWLVQHESQHCEIATFILQLHRLRQNQLYQGIKPSFPTEIDPESPPKSPKLGGLHTLQNPLAIEIPAGECYLGSNAINAQDNERPYHRVELNRYFIDRYPVTCGQYRQFMEAGGYQHEEWWSREGWQWLQRNPVKQPLYWVNSADWEYHPVCGVSYYEAEAYANFVGKRLPTQPEWEKAASWDAVQKCKRIYPWGDDFPTAKLCNHNSQIGHTTPVNAYPAGQSAYGCEDMLGNVWEWTSSWFAGYEGFKSYPYQGYSQVFFDHQHRVLMGGSWATRPWALRGSFRNWYHPWVRQILAGFRCASG